MQGSSITLTLLLDTCVAPRIGSRLGTYARALCARCRPVVTSGDSSSDQRGRCVPNPPLSAFRANSPASAPLAGSVPPPSGAAASAHDVWVHPVHDRTVSARTRHHRRTRFGKRVDADSKGHIRRFHGALVSASGARRTFGSHSCESAGIIGGGAGTDRIGGLRSSRREERRPPEPASVARRPGPAAPQPRDPADAQGAPVTSREAHAPQRRVGEIGARPGGRRRNPPRRAWLCQAYRESLRGQASSEPRWRPCLQSAGDHVFDALG